MKARLAALRQQMGRQMIVVFRREGQRRYSVEANRPALPNVVMNPAPGYDSLMPHDLMHMVVEAQLGLNRNKPKKCGKRRALMKSVR